MIRLTLVSFQSAVHCLKPANKMWKLGGKKQAQPIGIGRRAICTGTALSTGLSQMESNYHSFFTETESGNAHSVINAENAPLTLTVGKSFWCKRSHIAP